MAGVPVIPPWLREAVATAQRASEALRRSVGVQVSADAMAHAARALERYQVVSPSLERALKNIHASQVAVEGIQQLWRRSIPENWHGLEESDALDVVEFVEESGIPVVWVPRAELVEALIAADAGDRLETLVNSSAYVLDDLDMVLARARGADVSGHAEACEFAAEAIATARDGHWSAAQALAASGLGQVLHRLLGFGGLGAAHKKFSARDINEASVLAMKAALLEVCTVRALTDTRKAEPKLFNRHGTQHGDRSFFSQSSALGGLMLLVGWIREFAWLAEHRPGVFGDGDDVG